MNLEQAIVAAVLFITGIIIGAVLQKIRYIKKVPWGGNVVVDTRRPNGDTIGIESPHNVTHWKDYKEIRFTIVPLFYDKENKK